MKNNILGKVLKGIKETLEKDFRLDMDGTDERLAYLVYAILMDDTETRKKPKEWITDAFMLAPVDYWRDDKCTFALFQRSIYRSLHKAIDGTELQFEFFTVLKAIIEKVKL